MFFEIYTLHGKINIMLRKSTLNFLRNLKNNNQREWLEANRKAYEEAKADFNTFVDFLIKELSKIDANYATLQAKDCVFRINRDVRFSADKSPYKSNFGAAFSIGGKKSKHASFYVHIDPTQSFAGGGIWQPESNELAKIRQEIDYNAAEFKAILEARKFKDIFGGLSNENTLKKPPKGYDENNPMVEWLKLKSFVAAKNLKESEILSNEFEKEVAKIFRAMAPLIAFLNKAVEE